MSSGLLNQVLGNRTTAVYGDANVTAATIVPNLNNVSDGVNVNVIADSGQLKIFQPLTLDNTFLDSRTEEVFAQTVSTNILAIMGNLMGWVDKRTMVLTIPVTMQLVVLTTNSITNDIIQPFTNWIQPELAFLQPIIRFEVKLGNNNQIVQRSMMNYAEGLRIVALDQHYNWEQRILMSSQLGMPQSIGYNSLYMLTNGATSSDSVVTPIISYEQAVVWNAWKETLFGQSGAPYPYLTTELCIPIGALNSFFAEDAFLPVGLPYRFELEFNTATHNILFNNIFNLTAIPTISGTGTVQMTYGTNISLRYKSHILTQNIQDQINNAWITKPLLYQYDTYEYVEIIGDGATITLLKDIAINQQRPTTLIFRIMPTNSTTNTLPLVLGTLGAGTVNAAVAYFNNATTPGFRFKNLFIYIGGRQNYYLRMDTIGQGDAVMGGAAGSNNLINGKCYTQPGAHPYVFSHANSQYIGGLFYVNLNPGDFVKRGYISTDSGALVIRIQTDVVSTYAPTGSAMPNTHKLVIYKKYPEQIQINAAKNLNTIQWPAIAATNSYIIPSTYNMN